MVHAGPHPRHCAVRVGVGRLRPLASIQLKSGTVLVPSYHSPGNDNGLLCHGFVMLSDDNGTSWKLGATEFGEGKHLFNECQAAELANGSVVINARSLKDPALRPQRLQALSNDGGKTFPYTRVLTGMYEPVEGIEGSLAIDTATDTLLYAGAVGTLGSGLFRENLTLWESPDGGETWRMRQVVDPGPAGYCAMVVLRNGSAAVLWEMRDTRQLAWTPQHIVFRALAP